MAYVLIALGLLLVLLAALLWRRAARPAADEPPPAAGVIGGEERLNPQPQAPEQTADACWVPAGRAVTIHGYTIPRGMIYVGDGLYKDRRAWKVEDCLIDPGLPVSRAAPDHAGRTVSPWPAYSKLNPSARAAFLAWLAGGADAPDAHAGYVLLYLMGLERRLVQDRAEAEAETLRAEVRRLQQRYSRHPLVAAACTRILAGPDGGHAGL